MAVGIQADARELACAALRSALARDGGSADRARWREDADALRAQRQARLEAEGRLDTRPLKPQRVYAELRRALPPDTIVTLDAGAAPAYGYDRLRLRAARAPSSPRSTSAASASPSRWRWAPSSAGPRRPCSPSTATGAF